MRSGSIAESTSPARRGGSGKAGLCGRSCRAARAGADSPWASSTQTAAGAPGFHRTRRSPPAPGQRIGPPRAGPPTPSLRPRRAARRPPTRPVEPIRVGGAGVGAPALPVQRRRPHTCHGRSAAAGAPLARVDVHGEGAARGQRPKRQRFAIIAGGGTVVGLVGHSRSPVDTQGCAGKGRMASVDGGQPFRNRIPRDETRGRRPDGRRILRPVR